ncbi:MAG: exosome complex protein Rrp42 [Euryarchaeota archaeon]|nr:exosome complex protein Rrp42 [Euryarchaeota archaeon]
MAELEEIIPKLQANYVLELASKGLRIDGRDFDSYRPISIEIGFAEKAEGSAKVSLGATQVIVGVKVSVGSPFPDTPDRGILITNAELVPTASPTFEPGPPNENAIELSRIIDRTLRESNAIPLDKLVIEEGREVWEVWIDIHVIDYDGNLIDASMLGALAALLTTKIPEDRYGYGSEPRPLELTCLPLTTTFVKLGDYLMIDPNFIEEKLSSVRITVGMNEKGIISSIQKSNHGFIDFDEVEKIINKTKIKTSELREIVLRSIRRS